MPFPRHRPPVGRAALLAALAAVIVGGVLAATATSARTLALPMGLGRANGAKQLIVVTSASKTSTVATLRAFGEVNGTWKLVFGPLRARVGRMGWVPAHARREGDRTTPEGIFALGATMYGTKASPGVAYRFHRLVPGDYWDENPATGKAYNTFRHSSNTDCGRNPFGGNTECLWRESPAYDYFAVINFNTPSAGMFGSGIFLHVGTASATSGCVSIAEPALVRILRWLRPADTPRIVLAGPASPARF